MSAYVVEEDHIHALLGWAIRNQVSFYDDVHKARIDVKPDTASMVGTILLQTNVLSVAHRYAEAAENVDYEWHDFPHALTAVQVLKGVQCLEYQSCERDDWKQSMAYTICQAIKDAAIMKLAGYEAAPWGISLRAFERKARRA